MAQRKGESDGGPGEPVAPRPSTTSGTGKTTIQIELERADAERLLQALLGELVIDKQGVDDFVQKQWAASEKGRTARGGTSAAKHTPPSK